MMDLGLSIAIGITFFIALYFFLIRPQKQRMEKHKRIVRSVKVGDRVVTAGGVVGTVVEILDTEHVLVDIAKNTNVIVESDFIYKKEK